MENQSVSFPTLRHATETPFLILQTQKPTKRKARWEEEDKSIMAVLSLPDLIGPWLI